MNRVAVIGGGLAGVEAAWTIACRGVQVELFEMRPLRMTPAHSTGMLAEIVCSNSLKGLDPLTAHGLLKAEMEIMGSLVLRVAHATKVPAGKALAVDREQFAGCITSEVEKHPLINVVREEVKAVPVGRPVIIATGPLTTDGLAENISVLAGTGRMFFYDAIAPIVDAASIDYSKSFFGSRWAEDDKDYLNCPMNEQEYESFLNALTEADRVEPHRFEDAKYFEGCLPVEVIAARGEQSLRFGPMRPVGIMDPASGKRPYAVLQLRRENLKGDAFNMVGFQTRLNQVGQGRAFRKIPALSDAVFLRYGSIHRNTFIDSPRVLEKDLSMKACRNVFLAGQLTGVEGYVESACSGIIAGLSMLAYISGKVFTPPPPETAAGALMAYIADASMVNFQPMNINYGIIPVPDAPKKDRKNAVRDIAIKKIEEWFNALTLDLSE